MPDTQRIGESEFPKIAADDLPPEPLAWRESEGVFHRRQQFSGSERAERLPVDLVVWNQHQRRAATDATAVGPVDCYGAGSSSGIAGHGFFFAFAFAYSVFNASHSARTFSSRPSSSRSTCRSTMKFR